MRATRVLGFIAAALLSITAIAAEKGGASDKSEPASAPVTVLLLVPVEMSSQSLNSGCWAQLFDQRNFKGEAFTMIGPLQLDSADKAAGRAFRRQLDSLVTGPKATLTFYEHRMFKDRAVKFGPDSKEAGLIKKIGFSGRIESVKLDCGT